MEAQRSTVRWILLGGGAAFVALLAAALLTLFTAPIALIALVASIVASGLLLRRWVAVAIGGIAAALLIGSTAAWWITWGESFTYADASQPVPAPIQLLQLTSEGLAGIAGVALLVTWVWLLLARPRPRPLQPIGHTKPQPA